MLVQGRTGFVRDCRPWLARRFSRLAQIPSAAGLAKAWREHAPDLILFDLEQDVCNGAEAIAEIGRAVGPDDYLPLLAGCRGLPASDRERTLLAGAADLIPWPAPEPELMLRVGNALRLRQSYRRMAERYREVEAKMRERTLELERAQREVLERLALAAEYRDDDTGEHARRVGEISARIAANLGLAEEEVEAIRLAAPLHDLGKIGISDLILLKPGKLTPEEFETIKEHALIGAKVLAGSTSPFLATAETIARSHHERWDGSGYPFGLKGEAIPLLGRIVALADVYDALTSERPYKAAMSHDAATSEIVAQSGRHFDPQVVQAFLTAFSDNEAGPDSLPLAA